MGGGDKPEYRADLGVLGIAVRGYSEMCQFYDVDLDVSRFAEVARSVWWVRGIAPQTTYEAFSGGGWEDLNFEPDDSRELVSAFRTSYTGANVGVGIHDTGIWSGSPDFPGDPPNESHCPDW